MKICNKCNVNKEIIGFKKDPRNKNGLTGICIEFQKEQRRINSLNKRKIENPLCLTEKQCNTCAQIKSIDNFYRDSYFYSSFSNRCKPCKNIQTLSSREKDKQGYNEYMRIHRKNHPRKKALERNRMLKHRYGITQDQYNEIFISQEDKCNICKKHQDEFKRPLVVDHDHNTSKIRGLLCDGCNTTIAIFDNQKLLEAAKKHLKDK